MKSYFEDDSMNFNSSRDIQQKNILNNPTNLILPFNNLILTHPIQSNLPIQNMHKFILSTPIVTVEASEIFN